MRAGRGAEKLPRAGPAGYRPDVSERSPRLVAVLRAASFALPVALGVLTAPVGSTWRDDAALLAGAELVVRPGQGALTAMVTAAASVLPLGDLALRGAVGSALVAGVLSVVVFGIVRRVLAELGQRPVLHPVVACVAALSATLSPLVARESAVAGGGVVGGLLAALLLRSALVPGTSRGHVALTAGALLSLLAMERVSVALVVGLAMALHAQVSRRASAQGGILVALGALFPIALLLPLFVLRGGELSSLKELSLRRDLTDMFVIDVAGLRTRGLSAFFHDLGPLALGLALLGFGASLVRGYRLGFRVLAGTVPLVVMLVSDLLVPPQRAALFTTDTFVVVRIAAVVGAAVLAALGIVTVVDLLERTKLPFARPAGILVVTFFAATGAMAAEESHAAAAADRRGAVRWTEETLQALPPRAVVVLRTEPVLRRMVAARTLGGARPDVTLVALPKLGDRKTAVELLREEPKMLPILRDVGAHGAPGEAALSALADERPVYVELDPSWDPRLSTHVLPEHLLLRFAPQPLGTSDRRLADVDTRAAAARVLGAEGKERDPATREVLADHARQELIATSLAHDKDSSNRAHQLLADLGVELVPGDPAYPFVDPARTTAKAKGPEKRKR